MKSVFVFLTVIFSLSLAEAAPQAPTKAATCVACHGAAGISSNDMWPNLAGQKKAYLVKQMKAFRSDERKDPLMTPMSKALTDADIKQLATYFSSL